jgi:putative endonuclease
MAGVSKDGAGHEPMSAFVYMLRCADGSYYVGTTRGSLERRIAGHDAGTFGGYTSSRRPVRLVFQQHFAAITDAIAAERRLKGWTRAKKEALVRADFGALRRLASRARREDQSGTASPFETRPADAPQGEATKAPGRT